MSAPDFYVDDEAPHLGGYIRGGDAATHYPELFEWLVSSYGVRSVLDVGCGEGWTMRYFGRLGCRVQGVDGVPQDDERILVHDYTKRSLVLGEYDLVWSCEFVEHVEEIYVPNFLDSFQSGQVVLMTHADPGQPGHHHVNCQPAEYWRGAMAARGYSLDSTLTKQTRALAGLNENPYNHFARSGLAFIRNA